MTDELTTREHTELTSLAEGIDLERNPAVAFLAGTGGATKRTYRTELNRIADLITGQKHRAPRRPRQPGDGASEQEIADYEQALAEYDQARTLYHNRYMAVDWREVSLLTVKEIVAQLGEREGKATVNKALAVLKGVAGAAFDLGHIDGDELMRIRRIKGAKRKRQPTGRYVNEGERIAVFGACMRDQSPAGVRDAAILALGFIAAMRRSAIVKLDLGNYDSETGKLELLHAKGDEDRNVYVSNGGKDALDDWILIRGDEPGPMFYPIRKDGHIRRGERLTSQAVYGIIAKRCEEARIDAFSPHDMRRSAITDLIDRVGIAMAQKIAGHSSIQTTTIYDMSGEREKRKAAATLTVPYHRRTLSGEVGQ